MAVRFRFAMTSCGSVMTCAQLPSLLHSPDSMLVGLKFDQDAVEEEKTFPCWKSYFFRADRHTYSPYVRERELQTVTLLLTRAAKRCVRQSRAAVHVVDSEGQGEVDTRVGTQHSVGFRSALARTYKTVCSWHTTLCGL